MRALVVAIVLAAAPAYAGPAETVVVAGDDAAFRAALADALEPAGIAIVTREHVAAPPVSELAATSRALADAAGATATVWLLVGTDPKAGSVPMQATLVTYDRGVDRVLVRALPFAAPLSAAQAAEAARMARTMLRALRVTPDSDLPPPHAADAPAVRAVAPAVVPAAPQPPRIATSVGLGMRMRGPAADVAFAAEAAIAWRPDALGVAIVGSYAPAADVMAGGFAGTVHDDAIALVARLPVRVAPRVAIVGIAGPALHVVTLRGTLAGGLAADDSRVDAAGRFGAIATYAVDPTVDLGFGVSADVLLARQRYEADAAQVLEVPRVQVTAGAVLLLRLL